MSEYIYERPEQPAKVVRDGWNIHIEWDFVQREEIVRCRDCEHHDHGQCLAAQWSTASLMPAHRVKPDGFCSCGIRKQEHCAAGPVYVPLSDEEKDILGDMPALRKLFENMGARFE